MLFIGDLYLKLNDLMSHGDKAMAPVLPSTLATVNKLYAQVTSYHFYRTYCPTHNMPIIG